MPVLGKKHQKNLVFYTRRLVLQYAAYSREIALAGVTDGKAKEDHEAQAKLYYQWAQETQQILSDQGVSLEVVSRV